MGSPIQYAQLPEYTYQSFENEFRYQTFDPSTATYSYHPVSAKLLTSNDQDTKAEAEATETPKDETPEAPEPPKDESNSSSEGAPEGAGR